MFHLFNSLYVEVDREINERTNRVVISEQMGMPFLMPENDTSVIDLHYYANNLDQIGSEGFTRLLNELLVLDKVYIYSDEAAYIRMWAALALAYCPNIDYQTFRYLFLLKKTILDCRSTTTMREVGVINPVTITEPKVKLAYESAKEDWLRKVFVDYTADVKYVRSVEWDLMGVRLGNPLGTVPLRIRDILDRVLVTNIPDSLGYLSTFIGNPEKWDLVGADLDTLLGEDTIFQGCYKLNYLNNMNFVMTSQVKGQFSTEWLVEMIKELLFVLKHNNDLSIVAYMESILSVYVEGFLIPDAEALFKTLHKFFDHGPKMVRVSQIDIGKHDDNMIRYFINMPIKDIERITKGAKWLN
jgi:hypothetical protein